MESILQVIARLRRQQPRNPDTMRLCDEHEASLKTDAMPPKKGFDRKAYMRRYMKDRRAKQRGAND